jgi:2-hydroxy-3-keto-5-methylthiopentenyl-1-phosphate phosphatase
MLYIIDFDGTLATRDTVDGLLEKFADPEWQVIEQQWLDSEITAVECMRQQIRLIKADAVSLNNFICSIPLDPYFLPFYRHVSTRAKVAIVSDGLDYAVHVATRHADFPPIQVYANHLHFEPDGFAISYPHLNPQCQAGNGVCKCAVARTLSNVHSGPVVLVGDGKSDACLAHTADVVFAKGSLIEHCEREGIAYIPFLDFSDVLAVVQTWQAPQAQRAISFS